MRDALNAAPNEAGNKLLGLEALRFLTAFAILVFHYRHFAFVADEPVALVAERLPLYGPLQVLHNSGAFGVWIFWCISGFIFFWKYRDPIAERSVGSWKFFVLRVSRLYPLHLVTLLIVALLQPIYFTMHGSYFVYQANDLSHFLAQIFMASDWGIVHGDSFNGPIWSISVEVMIYFLFFLMLQATRSWLLNVAIVAACLGAASLHAGSQITNCLALFYAGGLAAMARRAFASFESRRTIEPLAWLFVVLFPPLAATFLHDQLDRFDLGLFLAYTPVLLFCLSREVRLPVFAQKAIEAAGNMTYSSYLLHFPIQLLFVMALTIAGIAVPLYDVAFFAVYLGVTLLASFLVYRYFETPAQRLLREILLRPGTKAANTALGATR
jgi:peptidoglycan/LPS O-acetylase OafA/YrhL